MRTRKKPESSKVTDYMELQEIINLATERGVKIFVERANKAGLSIANTLGKSDEEMFDYAIFDYLYIPDIVIIFEHLPWR